MPRSTRNRVILAAAALVAAALLIALGRMLATQPSADRTFAGVYSSDTDFRVANLTINGGHVRVGYRLDVLYLPDGEPAGLRCGLVDTSGRIDFFAGSTQIAASGAWRRLEFSADYELPELTLGIRCSPGSSGPMSVVFRDPVITLEQLP